MCTSENKCSRKGSLCHGRAIWVLLGKKTHINPMYTIFHLPQMQSISQDMFEATFLPLYFSTDTTRLMLLTCMWFRTQHDLKLKNEENLTPTDNLFRWCQAWFSTTNHWSHITCLFIYDFIIKSLFNLYLFNDLLSLKLIQLSYSHFYNSQEVCTTFTRQSYLNEQLNTVWQKF